MPTINDVAAKSGVGSSTVSRVLNGRPGVHVKTKERVLRAVSELGYCPNIPARALRGGNIRTLGVLVHKLSDVYVAGILDGVTDETDKRGYSMVVAGKTNLEKLDPINSLHGQGKVDGLIILSNFVEDDAYIAKLAETGVPHVLMERYTSDPRVNCIDVDNIQGGYLATCHLAELGHRRIAHLAGSLNARHTTGRIIGYQRALFEKHLPAEHDLLVYCDYDPTKAYGATLRLLALPNPPTAIFAATDEMAFGAIDAILDQGLSVPEDVAVVGFDDIWQASLWRPRLTTVHAPYYEMGELAARALINDIEGSARDKVKKVFPLDLVIRKSCGPGLQKKTDMAINM